MHKKYDIPKKYLLLPLLLICNMALADAAHQKNILPGSRAAFLGGAYTALSDDPSGGYYNPAGTAFAKANEVSITGNAFQESKLCYKEAINGEDFCERSQSIFPSFVGASYKWKSVSFGYSYLMLDSRDINQNDHFTNIYSQNNEKQSYNRTHQEANTFINVGAHLAMQINKYFSLGVSEFYYNRSVQATTHQLTRLDDDSILLIDYKYTTKNEGTVTVGGFVFRLDTFSLGVSVRLPRAISNYTKLYTDEVQTSVASDSTIKVTSLEERIHDQDELNPKTIQMGFAWYPVEYILFSGDIYFHQGVKHPYHDEGGQDYKDTFNYAVGAENRIKMIVIRGGYFSNNSMYQKLQKEGTNQPMHIDYWGASSSVGIKNSNWEGNLGIVSQIGSGEAQIITNSPEIQKVDGYSLMYLVSGSYTF